MDQLLDNMFNTVNVYWACIEDEWLRAIEPESVSSLFYIDRKYSQAEPDINMHFCPAFNSHLENLYALKSIYAYKFKVENNTVTSTDNNQDFFNRHVNIKSIDKKLFSFQQSFVFFTDADALKVTLSLPPYFENNNIMKRCTVIPGELDIAKWFRNTDMSFYLKDEYNEFLIDENEIYSYLKFHTSKKINFQQFRFNDTLRGFLLDTIMSKNNKKKILNIDKYYSMFSTKKLILKEIKNNLLG